MLKNLLEFIPKKNNRFLIAAILAGSQVAAAPQISGCLLDRSAIVTPWDAGEDPIDSALSDSAIENDSSTPDSSIETDSDVPDSAIENDSGSTLEVRCGMGLTPGFPLSYDIPTGMAIPAEIAVANMPPETNIAEIDWDDSSGFERVAFDTNSPSQALNSHTYTSPGTREVIFRLDGVECDRQTFNVVDGASTRLSCSGGFVFDGSDNIRVGENTTIRLNILPRSSAPGDSPLTYYFGNLPTAAGITTTITPETTARITATDPPGPGTYSLTGRACSPRGECASCAMPVLTVRP